MKSKICGIYKITSPSGRVYVGQSRDIKRRWWEYNNMKKVKNQTRLYRSFVKYGKDAHIFEIVEECSIEQLNDKEIYWGLYFKSLSKDCGLNLVLGNSAKIISDETRKKISEASKGRKFSEAHKKKLKETRKLQIYSEEFKSKISESLKNFYKVNPAKFIGCHHSIKTKKKLREIHLGQKRHSDEYKSFLSESRKGKNNMFFGKTHSDKQKKKWSIERKGKGMIPIVQLDINGVFIKEWECTKYAGIELNIPPTNITANCKNKTKTCRGFIFKYKSEINNEEHNDLNGNI